MKTLLLALASLVMLSFSSKTLFSQSYPPLVRYVTPGIGAPGDGFSPSFFGAASSEAPQAAEWTRTAGPDESVILTGHQLSRFSGQEEGKDTRFLIYSSGGVSKQARLQRLDGEKAVITLDGSLPSWSMYLVWPGNDAGWGAPMAINKTEAWWVGPDKAQRGGTVSVFGRNLAHANVEGSSNSHVYLKSISGSASQWASVVKVNPYRVDFTIPSSLSNGEYEVWVHNGHGGEWGWSSPLKLQVWDGPSWSGNTINVRDYGAKGDGYSDDAGPVKRAIEAAKNNPGSTIFFPAGTYMFSTLLDAHSNTRWQGEGKDKTILKCSPNFSSPYAFIFGEPQNFELNDMTIDANKSFHGGTGQPVFLRNAKDLKINNVRLSCQNFDPIDLHNTVRTFVTNSEIIGKGSFLGSASQLFIDKSVIKLTNDTDMGLYAWGVNGLSITNSICQDLDASNLSNLANLGKGRFLTSAGNWGSNRNTYLAFNTTNDLSPSPFSADLNSGEQFMWEGNTPSWKGNISSATANTVTLSGYNINEPNKNYLVVIKGKGLGQSRRVVANNGGTVTLDEPWNVIPDGSSVLTVGPFVDRVAIYKNYLDAKATAATQAEHVAAAGIEPYGGALNFIADNNTLHELRYGTSNWSQQWGDDQPWSPNYFTMYSNNKYINCRVAIQNNADARSPYGAAIFGTMYRKNVIQNTVKAAIENAVNYKHYPLFSTMVYEHNSCSGTQEAFFLFAYSTYQHEQVLAAGGMDNQLLYKNNFGGAGSAIMGSSKMGLRENSYSGFASKYSGILPDAVIEAPLHVIELSTSVNGAPIKTSFELWNSGTSPLGWKTSSSAAWLTISSTTGSIATEKENSFVELVANPQGLNAGQHKGYISVTAGSQTKVYTVLLNIGASVQPIAPTVNLTSPTNGSNFTAPASITFTADASDGDGTIAKVEFFNGSTKIGEDLTAPYSFTWDGVAEGTYSITAKATDNGGLSTSSHIVNISLKNSINLAPTVNLTSPTNNSTFTAPASITLTATASDADGTVSKVEFFNGSTKIGEDLTAPYSFSWNGVAEGTYSITAKATDNGGLSTSSQIVVISGVRGSIANLAPIVQLTSPSNGSNFTAPASVTLTADASDGDGTISKVEFFNGSTKLGEDLSAPYSFSWNGVAEGTYSITAKATDNGGLNTSSQSIEIAVNSSNNLGSTVILTSPTNGSNFTAPASITLTATASDPDGTVSKVEFFNGSTKIGEDLTAPYSFNWNGVANGNYVITAKATDNGGVITTSLSVGIAVTNSVANMAPTVNLTSPTNNSTFTAPASITLTATASDPDGTVSKVEFFNGTTKIGEDLTAPYSFSWNGVANGNYFVTAKATDNGGLNTSSQNLHLKVKGNNLAPTVILTSPTNGSNFTAPASITLTATASDPDGTVSKVEFFNGSTKIGEDLTAPYSFNWNGVANGNYVITAKATDNGGVIATSLSVEIAVTNSVANMAPTVNLTSPTNNSTFTAPASITLTATASDPDGTVSKVEFFNGTTKIGEDLTAPYSFSWNGVAEGTYSITAKATDNGGLNTSSQSIEIGVTTSQANMAPVISLTSPSNGSNFTAPASVTLTADASDGDGTIAKVEFFNGSTKIGEDLTAPYSFSWNGVAEGTYSITAKATDNGGLNTSSQSIEIGVTTSQANMAPVISLTSPSNGSNFTAPASVTLTADASDGDGTIAKVEFFNGSTKIGEDLTAPYSFTWDGVAEGTYSITAKATDNGGLSTSSHIVNISLKNSINLAPTVNLTSPTNNSTFTAPASITLTATASDADGTVSKVEFFNGSTKIGEDLTAPYSFSWNGVAEGTYSITAKATDNGGLNTSSQSIEIGVTTSQANMAPVISLTSPSNGSNFTAPASVTLTADASDGDGTISKVEFFNGSTKLGEDISAPYSFSWNGVAEGTYSITAKATDNGGLSTTSQTVSISLENSINLAPVVNLTSPFNGSTFTAPASITLTADASDGDGTISKVEFFNGSTKLGEDLSAPYSFSWNGVAEGTYSITAKATDNGGLSTSSQTIQIAVTTGQANLAPVVNLTSPSNGSTFTAPASITLTADASDGDGTISKVEFFNGSTKLGEDLSAPYSFSWNGVAEGTYSITAKATDNGGLSTSSYSIYFTVHSPSNLAPVVNLTSPSNGSTFTAPASITLTADASDGDGTISKVEFFNGSTKLGEDLSAPYSFSWNGVAEGTYSITAKATDNGGLSTSSQSATVVIVPVPVYPTVSLVSLTRGEFTAPSNIILTANAADADGSVERVEFFVNGIKIGDVLTHPYSLSWNNVLPGSYAITAKVTDNSGLISISAPMELVVTKPNIPPAVQLTSPTKNKSFGSPATITLSADATAYDSQIVKVEFFEGNNKLGEDAVFPYEFEWKNVSIGNYNITAKVTDSHGLSVTSTVVVTKVVENSKIKIYPNPVTTTTTIEFSMAQEAYAELQIFDAQGSLVSTAFKGVVKTNEVQQIKLDASALSRGTYFCRVIYNDGASYFKEWLEAKMIVIK